MSYAGSKGQSSISPSRQQMSAVQYISKSPTYYTQSTSPQPINTIKKANIGLPYESPSQVRAGLGGISDETDLWRSRCHELENSLCQANTDLELANYRVKKSKEQEEKLDTILKQNSNVIQEKDVIQKQLNQKKTESEIWKQKYENQMNSIINLKATYELDMRRLQQENARIREELDKSKIEKTKDLELSRSQLQTSQYQQVQNIKQNHCEDLALFEERIDKMRDLLEDKDRLISELQRNLEQARNEGDVEASRLQDDKQKLKLKMSQIEQENQKDLSFKLQKSDNYYQDHLQNQKKNYDNQMTVMKDEVQKLKELLEIKTKEIENLLIQNRHQKDNSNEEAQLLRLEIQELKNKIFENNGIKENEINALKEKLSELHSSDIEGLKFHHENQIDALLQENRNLQNTVLQKQQEIESQQKEKELQRQNYNQESDRLNMEIKMWRQKHDSMERLNEHNNIQHQETLALKNQENEVATQKNLQQISFLQSEIENLQNLLYHKNKEIEDLIKQHGDIRSQLENDNFNLKQNIEEQEQKFINLVHRDEQIIQQMKVEHKIKENDFLQRDKQATDSIAQLKEQIRILDETIKIKMSENDNIQNIKRLQDSEIRKLIAEQNLLQDQINQIEKSKNRDMEELRIKLEASHQFALESHKKTTDHQLNLLFQDINDWKIKYELKEREVLDMIQKYEKLEIALREFTDNPDRVKNFAEVSAIKNIYDVSLRTKSKSPVKKNF